MLQKNDTHPKIQEMIYEHIRSLSTEERIKKMDNLNRSLIKMALADIEQRYPNATPSKVRYLLAERMWGTKFADQVAHVL